MAARGNKIIITAHPKGCYEWGIIAGTPKPGTVLEIQTPFFQGGQHKWRVYQPGTDGNVTAWAVLLEDSLQGSTADTAYTDGTMGQLYFPVMGEELNVLYKNETGTGDDVAVGNILIVDSGTGKVTLEAGSPEFRPFQALAAIVDPTADVLLPVKYTGH